MDTTRDAIRTYFTKLGLEHEVADIYLALHTHGPQNISSLSRNADVERTRIYRLIDKLLDSNLIELESAGRRGIIKAAPIANLRILINRREEELRNLHDELGLIEQTLARNSLSNPAAHIQTFRGLEGVRHMMNNRLETTTEILCYDDGSLRDSVSNDFLDTWSAHFTARKLNCRLLSAVPDNTLFDSRPVKPEIFHISHPCDIYDDTVATYHWRDGEAFGIVIRNKELAGSQRQLFELLWRLSE